MLTTFSASGSKVDFDTDLRHNNHDSLVKAVFKSAGVLSIAFLASSNFTDNSFKDIKQVQITDSLDRIPNFANVSFGNSATLNDVSNKSKETTYDLTFFGEVAVGLPMDDEAQFSSADVLQNDIFVSAPPQQIIEFDEEIEILQGNPSKFNLSSSDKLIDKGNYKIPTETFEL